MIVEETQTDLMKKGLRLLWTRHCQYGSVETQTDLMKKGLRHEYFTAFSRGRRNTDRPDEEGIKTILMA